MEDFDWVAARSDCSLNVIFERLREQIGEDVKKRQAMQKAPFEYGFRISHQTKTISVIVEGHKIHQAIHVLLTDEAIAVKNGKQEILFTATPTLCDDRECRVKVGNEEKELWHLRKMALEDLFFASYEARVIVSSS